MSIEVSVVIPAYNEGESMPPVLDRIFAATEYVSEVLVIVDSDDDSTIPVVNEYAKSEPRLRVLVNTYGRGPARAIRYGFDQVSSAITVVTMADGSDDPRQIDDLARLVDRGVAVAAASRYAAGGQQVGGPRLKSVLSQAAGRSLALLARIGTHDATNSFKAYDTEFVRLVGIDSRTGFEIGLELTAKARRLRRPVAEIPTVWLDRTIGKSNFDMVGFVPRYLSWYFLAFGKKLTPQELKEHVARRAR
jgi:glycosyltransferase involved in cell wall biosynthesis